jgi:hypothetical protein
MQCKCGSKMFTPVGVQKKLTNNSPQVMYLVNCDQCRTTVSTSKTSYALYRLIAQRSSLSREFLKLYDLA